MPHPLVSVIVPTHNSARTLGRCLTAIAAQSYPTIELIVVDRNSIDDTVDIAARSGARVYNQGPERSAQRNFGARLARGEFIAMIDSDMELAPEVIAEGVDAMSHGNVAAVIIPEQSFGEGFWARCKALERSYYIGNDTIEAPRLFGRQLFQRLGGYNTELVSGEDWELGRRLRSQGAIARTTAPIYHDEGRLSFMTTIRKKYYYAQRARGYLQASNTHNPLTDDAGPLKRFSLFLSRPRTLLRRPHVGLGMLGMKLCEYAAGGIGYYLVRPNRPEETP